MYIYHIHLTVSCFYMFSYMHHYAYCTCSHFLNKKIRFIDIVFISGGIQFNLLIPEYRFNGHFRMSPELDSGHQLCSGHRCAMCFNFIGVLFCFSLSSLSFPTQFSGFFIIVCSEFEGKVLLHVARTFLQHSLTVFMTSYHDFLKRVPALEW